MLPHAVEILRRYPSWRPSHKSKRNSRTDSLLTKVKFHVVTLFPEMFAGPLTTSIIGRAVSNGILEIDFVNPRDFATDKHRSVDAPPYGGGPGMVMMAPPLAKAVESVGTQYLEGQVPKTLLMSPQGIPMSHQLATTLSSHHAITLVCGPLRGRG